MDKLWIYELRYTVASHAIMSGENLPLAGKLLGHRRHRARSMHTPFRGFAWAVSGSFRHGISLIFQAFQV